ncbi:hypothetical protein [Thiohalorhabdus sp.]|uniref:hypothetical protein n=1 Tax=Thiohalorhabdus sp. TaxID=3094134 RepID=UPI002FC2F9EF
MPQLTVDALNPPGTKAWRLQTDHSWRKARFAEALQEGDFVTPDPEEVRPWLTGRLTKDWRGRVTWEAAPGRTTFAPGEISLHAIAHRSQPAPVPDREELRQVIAGTDTSARRTLCLHLNGRFLLCRPEEPSPAGDPALAAYGDSLSGSAYLGPEATEDDRYIAEQYRNFLSAWYHHLRTGRVGIYAGEPLWDSSAAELAERIRAWEPDG